MTRKAWHNAKPAPKEWYETASEENPVLCWVSDTTKDDKSVAEWVTDYQTSTGYPFGTLHNSYKFATPVVCDDLKNN